MLPSRPSSLAAAAILLTHAAHVSAWPHFLNARQTNGPAPWVTVDASGIASTVTPSVSTVSGTSTTIINGAPAEVTGTVATVPFWDTTSLITGTPSPPKPTGDVAGAFPMCSNRDGKDAPFCGPTAGSQLFPGSRYYFTWDAKYFTPNASVVVVGHYYNESAKAVGDEAFRSPKNLATRGFWTYPIDGSILRDVLKPSETIIVQIITDRTGSIASSSRSASRRQATADGNTITIDGPIVTVAKPSGPVAEQHFTVPTGAALYIGLPAAGGFILLCVLGVCLWNRKHRKIEIGNIMSRGRHGYGAGKSARSRLRMGKSRKFKEHIQLRERELDLQKSQQLQQGGPREQQSMSPGVPSPGFYRDVSPPLHSPGKTRRDRDEEDLGSLAGTPVDDKRMNFDRVGGEAGNVFRDEVRRQNGDKF